MLGGDGDDECPQSLRLSGVGFRIVWLSAFRRSWGSPGGCRQQGGGGRVGARVLIYPPLETCDFPPFAYFSIFGDASSAENRFPRSDGKHVLHLEPDGANGADFVVFRFGSLCSAYLCLVGHQNGLSFFLGYRPGQCHYDRPVGGSRAF